MIETQGGAKMETGNEINEASTMSAEERAGHAISYALARIRDDSRIAYFCGRGTEMFARLTQAYADINGLGAEEVREKFACRDPHGPVWPKNRG